MFSWILARVNAKLAGWKENLISKGGKEILLKIVAQALPQYAMYLFKLPISICKAIEQRMATFWWQNSRTKSGIHWKSWNVLKDSKHNGGMGFRDLLTFNKALLGKQAWRLSQHSPSLWTSLFKGLYYHSTDFWHAHKGQRPSWGWQSILLGRESIKDHMRWQVGNGKSIRIRQDRWLKTGIITGPAPNYEPETVDGFISSSQHSWDIPRLALCFDTQTVQEIAAIPLQSDSNPDKFLWNGTHSGQYSVKSGYFHIRQAENTPSTNRASSSHTIPPGLWQKIWKINTAPKIRIFIWSICHNALPTKENLFRRHVIEDPICPLCTSRVPESLEHLFLACTTPQQVWAHPELNISVSAYRTNRMDVWLADLFQSTAYLPRLETIATTL